MTFQLTLGQLVVGRAAWATAGRSKRIKGRETLRVRGYSEPQPAIAAFFPASENLVTRVGLDGLAPLDSTLTATRSNRKVITRTIHGKTTLQHITRYQKGHSRRFRRQRTIQRPHFDPLSAILLLRSKPWASGKRARLQVITGKKCFLISAHFSRRTQIAFEGTTRAAIEIIGHVQRVADNGRALRKPPRAFTLWLSDDVARLPLKGKLRTKLGDVVASLTRYRPADRRLAIHLPGPP